MFWRTLKGLAVESYELALENKRLLRELQAANERLKDENIRSCRQTDEAQGRKASKIR